MWYLEAKDEGHGFRKKATPISSVTQRRCLCKNTCWIKIQALNKDHRGKDCSYLCPSISNTKARQKKVVETQAEDVIEVFGAREHNLKISISAYPNTNWSCSPASVAAVNHPSLSIQSIMRGNDATWKAFLHMPGNLSGIWKGPM